MMKPMMIALTLAVLTALTACETVEGAGRDLQTAGQAVTTEARRAQAGM
mgnify:CR=1 FL=1